jgi:hypothetical protein
MIQLGAGPGGAGKSTVGAARRLNCPFVDLDPKFERRRAAWASFPSQCCTAAPGARGMWLWPQVIPALETLSWRSSEAWSSPCDSPGLRGNVQEPSPGAVPRSSCCRRSTGDLRGRGCRASGAVCTVREGARRGGDPGSLRPVPRPAPGLRPHASRGEVVGRSKFSSRAAAPGMERSLETLVPMAGFWS